MIEIFEDIVQNTPEWFAVRAGIVTASKLSCVIARGNVLGKDGFPVSKTRMKYMRQLCGEIVTCDPMQAFRSRDMDRGHDLEPLAIAQYAMINDVDVVTVGFIRDGRVGCSPDGLIGNDGMLEIKSAFPDIIIEAMVADRMPPQHRAQTQGALWIAQREWIDLQMYWPQMPFVAFRQYRDEAFIRRLADSVIEFNAELDEMVAKVKRWQAYEINGGEAFDYGIANDDPLGTGFMV